MVRVKAPNEWIGRLIERIFDESSGVPSWLLPRGVYSVKAPHETTNWFVNLIENGGGEMYDMKKKRIFTYSLGQAESSLIEMGRDGIEVELLDVTTIESVKGENL
jgi:hypothetical protein